MINFRRHCTSALALAATVFATAPVHAEVTLTATDGTFTISGEFLELTEEAYRVQTDLGELFVRREFVTCAGEECPSSGAASTEVSSEVTLTSDDGDISVTGTLIDFSNTEFVLQTASGPLTIRREFANCEGAACPETQIVSDQFTITVASTVGADLVNEIVGDYTASKDFNLTQQLSSDGSLPTLLIGNERGIEVSRIAMEEMTTLNAIEALATGSSQFAITSDRANIADVSTAFGRQVNDISAVLNEEIIGLDAISFVVNAGNGIDVISFDAIRSVMSGQIINWSQLGGADLPITVHTIATNDALVSQLNSRGLATRNALENTTVHETADAMNAAVAADPAGFGVVYRSQADGVKALNLAMSCNIFVDNSDFGIQTEEHPLSIRWYQYTLKEGTTSEFAQNIGQFIPTDSGQQSIAATGFVTQQLQIVPMQDQGSRLLSTVLAGSGDRASNTVMRSYFEQAANARRISTSLRFLSGNATLDNKAETDIERISEIVRSNEYEGYEVLVFGFSDSFGTLDTNLSLSARRAGSVKRVLLEQNPGYLVEDNVRVFGIGPIAPIGCNDTAEGRDQNRRVEIWIRPRA